MKNKKNIKIAVIILSIVLVVIALTTATYSLFYSESTAANPENYSTGLLSITATSKSDNISLTDALPMTDEDGINSTPYTFSIKNIGNLDYKFDIKLLSTSSNTISPQYIKLKIDDGEVTTLSSLTNSVIKSDVTLKAKESIDITIRTWLSIDTPNSEIGKTFNSKLVADGQAVYTTTNYEIERIADTITKLYTPNTTAVNNSITYNYDNINNLMEDTQGNIRYYGASPNNYVYFNCETYPDTNCELWRIIGIVDGKVKLIRNESIGSYSWDTSASGVNSGYGINEWSQADLMKLLNPGYESNTDLNSSGTSITVNNSLYYNSGSGTCYSGSKNATKSCNFTNTGLKNDTTRNMISDSTYYLGGGSSASIYSNAALTMERGTTVISNPSDGITRTTSWTGKIGLMYPSDYGYATDFTKCSQTLINYDSSTDSYACRTNDWLYNGAFQWLLTPRSSNARYAWYVHSAGFVDIGNYVFNAYGVRPVLNLNSELVIESGSGTESDPYRISA
ncbi:MAG: hypothetical protein ACI4VL_02835 [Bacilli bacterium]